MSLENFIFETVIYKELKIKSGPIAKEIEYIMKWVK